MNIIILDSGYKSYNFEKQLFEKQGFSVKIHPHYKGDRTEKIEFAKDAHGLLVRHAKIDEEFLSKMKNLKAVVRYGIGYDNIDIKACTRFGVKVANVQGYATHAVSDHALAFILSCSRGFWNTSEQLIHRFAAPPAEDIIELHDKTLGIIGLGRIGSMLAAKAAPLFHSIIAVDPYKPQEHFDQLQVQRTEQVELLEKSDVISLHCSLTSETFHILNDAAFQIMQKKPIIINTSRGSTIHEKSLLNALNTEIIHSAGLDVYEDEPVTRAQKQLIEHSRTICTGHYAWYSNRAAMELQQRAAKNLLCLLQGKKIADSLN
ncbi:MAG: C-terminal binding protein [Prolixibacteraceae bacterium]